MPNTGWCHKTHYSLLCEPSHWVILKSNTIQIVMIFVVQVLTNIINNISNYYISFNNFKCIKSSHKEMQPIANQSMSTFNFV